MKRMLLSFVLVMFSSCIVHAESSSKDKSAHVGKGKRDRSKIDKKNDAKQKDDDVVYLDMSTPDDSEDNKMPAITPKGKL